MKGVQLAEINVQQARRFSTHVHRLRNSSKLVVEIHPNALSDLKIYCGSAPGHLTLMRDSGRCAAIAEAVPDIGLMPDYIILN